MRCRGNAGFCQAQVSILGAARNRKLIVRLPGTDLRLQSIDVHPRSALGGYVLSNGQFAQGGAEYVAMVVASRSAPPDSRLTLAFRALPRVQYSRSFHTHNLSSHPIKLINITGDGNFEGRPPDGSILPPDGGYNRIEVQWRFFVNQYSSMHYAVLGKDGRQVGAFDVMTTVFGLDGSQLSDCTTSIGECTTGSTIVTLLDSPNTVVRHVSRWSSRGPGSLGAHAHSIQNDVRT